MSYNVLVGKSYMLYEVEVLHFFLTRFEPNVKKSILEQSRTF
jgi:hypothetical protein